VHMLAAPQDALFCVGDEDQCIFAWRRASVERLIDLDRLYPGLERHALEINYRCARKIVLTRDEARQSPEQHASVPEVGRGAGYQLTPSC
jgi:superfamily I DNA/RNA helicase